MEKLFHTVITSRRHRELGYCEDSDFGKIELIKLKPEEKKLIVSFKDYNDKKEYIEHDGFAFIKTDSSCNFWGCSREKSQEILSKQGKFSEKSAINLMLSLRKRTEYDFSYVRSNTFLLIGKTLYEKYCINNMQN
jgi:hypothetical protein